MRTLSRYILREVILLFTLTTVALVGLYLVIEVFEKVDNLIEHGAGTGIIVKYFLLEVPLILSQMLPFSTLIGVILALGLLSRSREIMAAEAMGIGPLMLALPVAAFAFLLSILYFFYNEYMVTDLSREMERMKMVWVEGRSKEAIFRQLKVWLKDGDRIYNVRLVEPEKGRMSGLTIFTIREGRLLEKMDVREALWMDGRWVGRGVRIMRLGGEGIKKEEVERRELPLRERPEDLKDLKASARGMDILKLKSYIDKIEEEGYDSTSYRVDLYNKVSLPFGIFVMALLGISFGLARIRGGLTLSLPLAVVFSFSYWLIQALSTALGYGGVLPPLLASWLPNLSFLALSGLLLIHVR